MAERVAMYRAFRTSVRPPAMVRLPRIWPESRLTGATPTRAAIRRRSSWPSSGRSAIRVREVTSPTPGTDVSRSSAARQIGEPPHGVVDFAVQFGELGFEGLQRRLDRALDAGIARLPQPVGLHADHFHDLTAAGYQFSQSLAVGIRERTWFGANAFSEQGDDLSIERVGFGEPPGGAGEIPDLTRIDDGEWQAGAGQSRRHGDFESARGFEHDQSRGQIA